MSSLLSTASFQFCATAISITGRFDRYLAATNRDS